MKPTTPSRISSLIPSRKSTAILVLFLLAATIFTWRVLHDQFFTETDLSVWQRDWMELEICNKKVQSFCTSISKYPFAYLLNSGAANLLAGRTHIDQWWGGLRNASTTLNSAACAIALLAATCTATSREKVSILIYCLALLLTPIPDFYIMSGSLEVQSGIFFSLFALYAHKITNSASSNATAIYKAALPLFLGCLYKDTYSIIWILTGLATWAITLKQREKVGDIKANRLIYLSLATFSGGWAAFVVGLGFNRYRYVSITPAAYLQESAQTRPDAIQSLKFLLASIFSQNGGVLSFWGLALSALTIIILARGSLTLTEFIFASSFPVICLAMHSLWWAPFGWDAWGNRLIIPSMMFTLAALSLHVPEEHKPNRTKKSSIRPTIRLLTTAALTSVIVFSSGYIIKPIESSKKAMWESSLYAHESCQAMSSLLNDIKPTEHHLIWKSRLYYDCAHERFWSKTQ